MKSEEPQEETPPARAIESVRAHRKENGMKRKETLGILAIALTVLACYVSYHQFRAAVIGLAISAIALPVVFYLVNRRIAWLSVVLAVVMDLALYWPEFRYYESRGLFICAALVQIAVMAGILLALKRLGTKART